MLTLRETKAAVPAIGPAKSLIIGCVAALFGCMGPSERMQCLSSLTYPPALYVLRGHRLTGDGQTGMAVYQVEEKVTGSVPTNIVELSFFQTDYALPQRAVLVLTDVHPLYSESAHHRKAAAKMRHEGAHQFFPVGMDAYRGILPDTAEMVRQIKSVKPADLVGNPETMWITQSQAFEIACAEIKRRGRAPGVGEIVLLLAKRYSHGWTVSCTTKFPDASFEIGGTILVVGDDRQVK